MSLHGNDFIFIYYILLYLKVHEKSKKWLNHLYLMRQLVVTEYDVSLYLKVLKKSK